MIAARVLYTVTCLFGLGLLVTQFWGAIRVFPGSALLAVVLQLVVVAIGFVLLRWFRPVRRPPAGASLAAVAWGMTAATGCALLANQGLLGIWSKTAGIEFASDWAAALSAPINEELLKVIGVALLVLAAPALVRGPVDGLVYGALTGLGFQVMENITYALNQITQSGATAPALAVLQTSFVRVVLTGPGSHWAMSAVAGAGIGYLAARGLRGLRPAVLLLFVAMAMHWFFDAPLLTFVGGVVIKVAVNFVVVAILYLVLRRGYLRRARSVLRSGVETGAVSPAEAAFLLKRRSRRRALKHAPVPERAAAAQRLRVLVDQVDLRAADALTFAHSRHPSTAGTVYGS